MAAKEVLATADEAEFTREVAELLFADVETLFVPHPLSATKPLASEISRKFFGITCTTPISQTEQSEQTLCLLQPYGAYHRVS